MENAIDKTNEWVAWWWTNVKINKESFALLKQIVNISKEDIEDYNRMMFTYAMDFFKECTNLKKSIPKHFFTCKLIEWFIDRGFGNPWQLATNKIHETPKMTLCNFKQASLGVTRFQKQSVKMLGESSDIRLAPKPQNMYDNKKQHVDFKEIFSYEKTK